jgi:hypothetical protein
MALDAQVLSAQERATVVGPDTSDRSGSQCRAPLALDSGIGRRQGRGSAAIGAMLLCLAGGRGQFSVAFGQAAATRGSQPPRTAGRRRSAGINPNRARFLRPFRRPLPGLQAPIPGARLLPAKTETGLRSRPGSSRPGYAGPSAMLSPSGLPRAPASVSGCTRCRDDLAGCRAGSNNHRQCHLRGDDVHRFHSQQSPPDLRQESILPNISLLRSSYTTKIVLAEVVLNRDFTSGRSFWRSRQHVPGTALSPPNFYLQSSIFNLQSSIFNLQSSNFALHSPLSTSALGFDLAIAAGCSIIAP